MLRHAMLQTMRCPSRPHGMIVPTTPADDSIAAKTTIKPANKTATTHLSFFVLRFSEMTGVANRLQPTPLANPQPSTPPPKFSILNS
jgi:hypothetical protein